MPPERRYFLLTAVLSLAAGIAALGAEEWTSARGSAAQAGRSASSLSSKPSLIWSYEMGSIMSAPCAILGNRVLALSSGGRLACLDRVEGRLLWKRETGVRFEAAPAAVNIRESPVFVVCDAAGMVMALDGRDGRELWRRDIGARLSGGGLALESGLFIVGAYDNILRALSLDKGGEVWRTQADGYINAAPSAAGGLGVFGSCDGFIRIVDLGRGMLTRTVDAGTYLPSVLPIEAGTAYALDYRGGLRAIRLDSGAVLWETSLSEVQGTFPSPPAVDADSIYIVSNAGHVLRLRRADASRAWKAELGIGCQLAPLAAQDALLCLGEDGFLTALDKRSGKELWSLEIGAGSACPPVIADGRVFLGDGGGHLLCLGAGKGKR